MTGISLMNSISTYDTSNTTNTVFGQGSIGSQALSDSLTITDFYKLLATQLQYQDADNPMDTAEMMNQLVQTQMSQSISLMTTAVNDLATVNMYSYATSMMGKTVTVAEVDENGNYTKETTTGVVTGISLGSVPVIYIDGKEYSLVQIMSIGDVPPPEETEDPSEGGDGQTGEGLSLIHI